MKYLPLLKIVVFAILAASFSSCADEERAKKYSNLRLETNEMISLVDIISKDQKAKYDSLHKVGNDIVTYRITSIDIDDLEKATMTTLDIQEAMSKLKIHLESIRFYCTIIEKASTRFGYLIKPKQKIKNTYINLLNDKIKEIEEVTAGLSCRDYLNNYLTTTAK